jgi:hypothetical protein
LGRIGGQKKPPKKNFSLSLDADRIEFCEALRGAHAKRDVAKPRASEKFFFRGSLR